MPTSTSDRAYVWVWPPGWATPVPGGLLTPAGDGLEFRYADSYLARADAFSLGPGMPLDHRAYGPVADLGMPGPLRDAAPDAWGRRVLLNRLTGRRARDVDTGSLSELVYLLESGSNRFGAVDFQQDARGYVARAETATLDDLHRAADLVQAGEPLPDDLAAALVDGTTMGGARPKALLADGDRQWIAKFSTSEDTWSVVGAEAACIDLARRAGILVPEWRVARSLGRQVLLTKRFDRGSGGSRRAAVSALTVLELGEMTARYGTYPEFVQRLRQRSADPSAVGPEMFARVAFNMAISNTDDHLRNHAAFWDGARLELTPAYDLSPAARSGETASQAMAYGADGRRSSVLTSLIEVAHEYDLTVKRAREIVQRVVGAVREHWVAAAERAELTEVDRRVLWGRQLLNPGTVRGLEPPVVAPGFEARS